MTKLACAALMPDRRTRRWLLAPLALMASGVQAHAAAAIVLPLPVALAFLGLAAAILVILWTFIGISNFVSWLAAKRRLKSDLKQLAQQQKARLPLKMGEVMTWTDVVADGLLMTHKYTIDTSKFNMPPNFIESMKLEEVPLYPKALAVGLIYRFIYYDPQGKTLGTYDVTSADFEYRRSKGNDSPQ